jgi:hypothetical protein
LGHFSKNLNEEVAKSRDTFGIGQDEAIEALTSVLGKVQTQHAPAHRGRLVVRKKLVWFGVLHKE